MKNLYRLQIFQGHDIEGQNLERIGGKVKNFQSQEVSERLFAQEF